VAGRRGSTAGRVTAAAVQDATRIVTCCDVGLLTFTTTAKEVVALLPAASVAVQLTVVFPTA
jgi:hypothetical protein